MKLLNRHTDYAVQALCEIAKSKKRLPVRELCEKLDTPYPFLRGVLQRLAARGFVTSVKGKNGGFSLAKPADTITLYDLIEVLYSLPDANHCKLRKRPCPKQKYCTLKKRLIVVENKMKQELRSATIASLIT